MSSLIPETAPFSDEQRAWLNGFFAGMIGIRPEMDPGAALAAAGIDSELVAVPSGSQASADAEDEEDFPWHDASLPIVDRMELAADKPLNRKLMAAMAQLNCGSCGYVCQSYSDAIASGEETNLTLCSPGGKETKQMIKKLLKENQGDGAAAAPAAAAPNGSTYGSTNGSAAPTKAANWSRQNPFTAKLIESRPLNGDGSSKDTRHVAIDLGGSDLHYEVGDALGIYPTNCPDLATAIIDRLGADIELAVDTPLGSRKSLLHALVEDCCLRDPSDELIELVRDRCGDPSAQGKLGEYAQDGVPEGFDVLDILQLGGEMTITATEFMATMEPLNPRLYSIASSMKKVGNEVHLTVGKVSFERDGRVRKGVASTMLAERIGCGDTCRVFVQPNHGGFTVPADPSAPMIMVGPGTGIAPFLAFLQEREKIAATGRNWLLFGDQHEATDFLYQETLRGYCESGLLTRLDTAFSRDGDHKVYVQDRMRQQAAELWQWLCDGGYFFVCGDAKRMAQDVHQTLLEIIAQQGQMSPQAAADYLATLQADRRYVRDVY